MDKPSGSTKVAQLVTDKVIAGLSKGDIPWQKPWLTMRAHNFRSGYKYTGINPLLLAMACEDAGYSYPTFATYKQISELGGQVQKGEHGTIIVFTKKVELKGTAKEDENGEITAKNIFLLRYYRVFNIEQTDLDAKKVLKLDGEEATNPDADELFRHLNPQVKHGGMVASYSPVNDKINIPHRHDFTSLNEYHLTAFHEKVHWSGAPSRLGRFEIGWTELEEYSQEELVAEIGANMMLYHCGLDIVTDNSQAYINGWLKRLRNDERFVILAASQAQKAYDYLTPNKDEGGGKS